MQRGRYRKSEQRREEILEAAFAVFTRSGYAASSVSEIAREVGMSQPGLLHHFDGKPALLQAVLEDRDARTQRLIADKEGIELFRALVQISAESQSQRGIVQLYAMLSAEAINADHPAHEYIVRRARLIVTEMAQAFEKAQERGELLPGVSPQQAALESVAFTEGVQLLWLQGFVEIDLGEQARMFFNRYFREPL